jgi:hypothetical protein
VLPIFRKIARSVIGRGLAPVVAHLRNDTALGRPLGNSPHQKNAAMVSGPQDCHFANDRTLSDAEIETLVNWVDGGAPRVIRNQTRSDTLGR